MAIPTLPVPVDFGPLIDAAIANLGKVVAVAVGGVVVLTAFARVRAWVVLPMQQKLAAEATTNLLNSRKAWKNVGTRKAPVYEMSDWGKSKQAEIEAARGDMSLRRNKRGKVVF